MKKYLLYRLKRKLLVGGIKNEIVKNNYIRYLNYNYLKKEYHSLIDNTNYESISKEETKKIWVCWFQGIDNAPDIVKINFNKLKETFPDYEVIMITEDNYKEFVNIPSFLIEKFKKGIISYAHFSDIIRIYLLCDIGGIWIDSTVYTTAKSIPHYLSNNKFFMFKEVCLDRSDTPLVVASNWFIKSNKNNPILLLVRDLLCQYWSDTNILIDYFIFHIFFSLATTKYQELWDSVPTYNNINPHVMQFELFNKYDSERFKYYETISDFHKLTYKFKKEDIKKNTNLAYIMGEYHEK